MLPPTVTDAAITSEIEGAMAWAVRHGIDLTARMPKERVLRVVLVQNRSQEKFFLQGQFDQYKALPPVWDWRDANWSDSSRLYLSPKPENTPFGSSMFLVQNNKAIICAPFNRLAFNSHGGPHSDWGEPTQWMTAGNGYVYAVTIGDMLQAILRDFRCTKERMG